MLSPRCSAGFYCRLPKLNSIAMPVQGRLPQLAMATLLYSMRTQLTGLQTQELVLYQNWKQANQPWQELGRYTNLTSLMITFKDVSCCCCCTSCQALACVEGSSALLLAVSTSTLSV